MRFLPLLLTLVYLMMPFTVVLGFGLSVAALAEPHEPEEPEHPSEAVDALIEAGREEGILEESDRQLIQSVVEFGDKTVREVMTPRPDIFAVSADTTIEQFTAMLREKPHSRVPVYVSTIDNIQGMVLSHDLIQINDSEAGDHNGPQAHAARDVCTRDQEDFTASAGDAEGKQPPGGGD